MTLFRSILATVLAATLVFGALACQPQEQRQGQQAAVDTSSIMSTLDSVRSTYEEAYAAGDLQTIASVAHAEMIYSPPGRPPIRGRDSIVAYEKQGRPTGATVDLDPIETRVISDEWAYDFGTATLTFTPEGAEEPQSVENTYLVLLRRTEDGWKTYGEVISSNRPPPGAQ